MNEKKICPVCDGFAIRPCPWCNGYGCRMCGGKGNFTCVQCDGKGYLAQDEIELRDPSQDDLNKC